MTLQYIAVFREGQYNQRYNYIANHLYLDTGFILQYVYLYRRSETPGAVFTKVVDSEIGLCKK